MHRERKIEKICKAESTNDLWIPNYIFPPKFSARYTKMNMVYLLPTRKSSYFLISKEQCRKSIRAFLGGPKSDADCQGTVEEAAGE